jgi:hypothetical protein
MLLIISSARPLLPFIGSPVDTDLRCLLPIPSVQASNMRYNPYLSSKCADTLIFLFVNASAIVYSFHSAADRFTYY